MKTVGRPQSTRNLKGMSFRFRPEFAKTIKAIAKKERISQVKVLEAAIARFGKELSV